jgi:hypothetical protein
MKLLAIEHARPRSSYPPPIAGRGAPKEDRLRRVLAFRRVEGRAWQE